MKVKFIEASQNAAGGFVNWGKFAVARFESDEWRVRTEIGHGVVLDGGQLVSPSLLAACGWTPEHLWVMDCQTGEGAYFRPGGYAKADLEKHAIWVCPMFEPFLTWLWTQDTDDLDALPTLVELPEADFAMYGYRREGPKRGLILRTIADTIQKHAPREIALERAEDVYEALTKKGLL